MRYYEAPTNSRDATPESEDEPEDKHETIQKDDPYELGQAQFNIEPALH